MRFSTTVSSHIDVDVDINDDEIVEYVLENDHMMQQVLAEYEMSDAVLAEQFVCMDTVDREKVIAHLHLMIPGIVIKLP